MAAKTTCSVSLKFSLLRLQMFISAKPGGGCVGCYKVDFSASISGFAGLK